MINREDFGGDCNSTRKKGGLGYGWLASDYKAGNERIIKNLCGAAVFFSLKEGTGPFLIRKRRVNHGQAV